MTELTQMTEFVFLLLKQQNKEDDIVTLIGINLYSVLFVYLLIRCLERSANTPIVPENKAPFVYCNVYLSYF